MYIINLFGYKGTTPGENHDRRIVEIPGLIDENGSVIRKNLDWIKEENESADEPI